MKKVLFALVLVGGIFALSSCSKECNCVGKYKGEIKYEKKIPIDDGEKCSDYNFYLDVVGIQVEVKCTPVLF